MPATTFRDALHRGITPSQRRNKVLAHIVEEVKAGRPSYHSAGGFTVCAVMMQLEEAGVPYRLVCNPGVGYEIQAYKDVSALLTATSS